MYSTLTSDEEETASSTQLWSLHPANKWNCKTVAILIILRNHRILLLYWFYVSDGSIIFNSSNVIGLRIPWTVCTLVMPCWAWKQFWTAQNPLYGVLTSQLPWRTIRLHENVDHVVHQVSKSIKTICHVLKRLHWRLTCYNSVGW